MVLYLERNILTLSKLGQKRESSLYQSKYLQYSDRSIYRHYFTLPQSPNSKTFSLEVLY